MSNDPSLREKPFCHAFDLTKRLATPADARIHHIPLSAAAKPLESIIDSVSRHLASSPPGSIHRLVIPTLLSPALYPPHAGRPEHLLQFMHSLRSLLRQHSHSLTAMMTFPLELYPRDSGTVRWAELLSDGVLELTPFPHLMDASSALYSSGGGTRGSDEQPQGMLRVHKLPLNTERGEGGAGAGNSLGEDLAFSISRRRFVIRPYSLPPLEGDQEARGDVAAPTGKDVEF